MKKNNHAHRPVMKTIWPGQPGSIGQMRRFGKDLVCVRYRHDAQGEVRYTTVELIIDHARIPSHGSERRLVNLGRIDDISLRARAISLGAQWQPQTRQWRMSIKIAKALGLIA